MKRCEFRNRHGARCQRLARVGDWRHVCRAHSTIVAARGRAFLREGEARRVLLNLPLERALVLVSTARLLRQEVTA